MKASRLCVIVVILLLSYSQLFAASIDIGPQPFPNLNITTPPLPLKWYEMYIGKDGTGSAGVCYSTLQGDAMDGKHIGAGVTGIFNIWGPYIGITFGASVDISWGNFYNNKDLKFLLFSERVPVSLLVQIVRIDNAAVNLYGGGDIGLSSLSIDINGDKYENAGSMSFVIPYGYHFGIQASGKYAGLAFGGVVGFQSLNFKESKLEYENIDDGNTYYFKMPAETISNYFYGVKLSIIPWGISIGYTTQTFKKSDKTGFPEFTQNTIMVTYTFGYYGDVKEEKKEEKPKPKVETL